MIFINVYFVLVYNLTLSVLQQRLFVKIVTNILYIFFFKQRLHL